MQPEIWSLFTPNTALFLDVILRQQVKHMIRSITCQTWKGYKTPFRRSGHIIMFCYVMGDVVCAHKPHMPCFHSPSHICCNLFSCFTGGSDCEMYMVFNIERAGRKFQTGNKK